MREITSCDVCGSLKLVPVLDLGKHPLCDDLVPIGSDRVCEEYPIEILFCETCKTAHQKYQLPKEVLFPPEYHYRARFTRDVTDGMEDLVQSCEKRLGSLKGKTVLDVGCNDGCLLDIFKSRGAKTLGIEPTDASRDAMAKGHGVISTYFGDPLPTFTADIITFTNVFAHLEDLDAAIESLRAMCHSNTTIVIENHYLGSILSKGQFDTFYHEHPRTYSATSFKFIAERLGLKISHMRLTKRYGGNIRVFLARQLNDSFVSEYFGAEEFSYLRDLMETWQEAKSADILKYAPLPAIAFPGRASILLRLLGLNEKHITAVYQKHGSPKIGHYVPGTRIPILSDQELPDCETVLNLAWHIPQEVRMHLAALGYTGKVIDICTSSALGSGSTVTNQPSTSVTPMMA